MDDVRVIEGYQFGSTVLHPIVLVALLIAVILIFALPRRYVLVPILLAGILIPDMQRIVALGFGFTALRIVCLAGVARIVFTRSVAARSPRGMDALFLAWVFVSVALNVVQLGTMEALNNRLGFALTAICAYFLVRNLVTSPAEVLRIFKVLAVICIVVALSMLMEEKIGHSIFAFLGGMPDSSAIRVGRTRCQGPFSHPILAGTFGAVSFPLVCALVTKKGTRMLGIAGIVGALIIVVTSASSGPLMSLLISGIGLAAWPLRRHLRPVRLVLVVTLLGLSVVMKSPIWSLIGRIDVVGGSTGYYRYELIDAFIRNASQWIFAGTDRAQFWGWGLQDITNQYILEGINAGLATLILFVALIAVAFRHFGKATRAASGSSGTWQRVLWWAVGAQLLCHVVSFLSVSYFDQSVFMFYLTLGLAAASRMMPRGEAETPATVLPQPGLPALAE